MRVADTSFLYALFSEGDVFHQRAIREAERHEPILVPAEILSETLALIQYRHGFDLARTAGEWLRTQDLVETGLPTGETLDATWREFTTAHGRLSYPDAVVVRWCRSAGADPLSYDTHLLAYLRG